MTAVVSEPASVLLVNDNPSTLLAWESSLAALGQNLVRAGSGREALRLLLKQDCSVVLLDIRMPGMDGFETAAMIRQRERSANTPIIFVTASRLEKGLARQAYSLGAVDFVVEPIVPEVLRARVAVFVNLWRQARALRESTDFLSNILDSSTEYAIIATDLDGNILAWNKGAQRIYGYATGEMVAKGNWNVLFTAEDLDQGRPGALLEAALRAGMADRVFERVRKDGTRFTASEGITLRRDATGRPVGYLVISKDITQQQILEEQLRHKNEMEEQNRRVEEANRHRGEFLANMSHELRTPLNAVIGFTELIHDGKVGPISARQKEFLGDVLTSVRHLLHLISDMLDLSKVETGRMAFRPEPVALDQLIPEVRDSLGAVAAGKRISIEIDIDAAVASVVLDPSRLRQVLYNYLSNALKFTAEEGGVAVRIRPQGPDQFRLEVEDTGIGISPDDIGRLFIEFQQLDNGMAKKYQGSGLGLALTKRIVEEQGGQVGVRSTPGKGSVFYAILPRCVQAGEVATQHQ